MFNPTYPRVYSTLQLVFALLLEFYHFLADLDIYTRQIAVMNEKCRYPANNRRTVVNRKRAEVSSIDTEIDVLFSLNVHVDRLQQVM